MEEDENGDQQEEQINVLVNFFDNDEFGGPLEEVDHRSGSDRNSSDSTQSSSDDENSEIPMGAEFSGDGSPNRRRSGSQSSRNFTSTAFRHSHGGESSKSSEKKRIITFNKDLPAAHSYLGDDLDDAGGGQTIIEQESIKDNVPLLAVQSLILMPGQILPLQNLPIRQVEMFRQIITHHKLFAVVTMRLKSDASGFELSSIGTLAQVKQYKEESDAQMATIKAKAVGTQRFELLSKQRTIDGTQVCKVRILPEYSLPPPLSNHQLPSLAKFSVLPVNKNPSQLRRPGRQKFSKYLAAPFSQWPWFVYKQFDVDEIVEQMISELCCWYDEEKIRVMSQNRSEFSFWVASNLPIENEQKLNLLSINCTLKRLKCELMILKQETVLCCARCGRPWAVKSDIFSMSVDGPMGAYVNPGGVIHEMFTLSDIYKAGVGTTMKRASTQNSWFPGYAWNILECKGCSHHAGWKFTRVKNKLKPKKFYGLTRAAITPRIISVNRDEEAEDKEKPTAGIPNDEETPVERARRVMTEIANSIGAPPPPPVAEEEIFYSGSSDDGET